MDFIAIDVETANSDRASICQIGIAAFSNTQIIDEWVTLVNPEDDFDPLNVGIHKINEEDVADSPTFPEILPQLLKFFTDNIVVSHTSFDRLSITRAFFKYHIDIPEMAWLDSASVVRRAWPEFSKKGYGLSNVAEHIGYKFRHHDALEDAKASGHILLEAIKISGLDISDWQVRVNKRINLHTSPSSGKIKREGKPEGPLYGEVIVFTGELLISRAEAADLAAKLGCNVAPRVTKKTTILVVGDQDMSKLSGKEKSSKHMHAESLINSGQNIQIIMESDFHELLKFVV